MSTRSRETDEHLMRRCFELARQAVAAGNHPFGALLARDGEVQLEARNSVGSDGRVSRIHPVARQRSLDAATGVWVPRTQGRRPLVSVRGPVA